MVNLSLTTEEQIRLERVEGIVFDIQRYSLHDGPGLRTNIFLKGCPLRCAWCANPESQAMQPELALFEHNCMTCGQFETPCPVCWDQRTEKMAEFDQRAAVCPTGAVHWIGQRRMAGDVMREVRRDIPFYEDGGGMTLTGGEATMQPDMAEALLRLAKADYISTAIETCGHTRWTVFERLVPFLDDILYDLKHIDSQLHQTHTGLDNGLILSNLRRLAASGAPVTVRIPLIPGFNATFKTISAMADFVASLGGSVKRVDVLPYHTLGKSKYAALGRNYPWREHERLSADEIEALAAVVRERGLPVEIGG
jgi:pyruvate formate lyase activating enzyme